MAHSYDGLLPTPKRKKKKITPPSFPAKTRRCPPQAPPRSHWGSFRQVPVCITSEKQNSCWSECLTPTRPVLLWWQAAQQSFTASAKRARVGWVRLSGLKVYHHILVVTTEGLCVCVWCWKWKLPCVMSTLVNQRVYLLWLWISAPQWKIFMKSNEK